MKSDHKYSQAGNFFIDNSQPTEAEIDAMSVDELTSFLSDNGVNLAKLNADIPQIQENLTSQILFLQAGKIRKENMQNNIVDLSEFSQEQLIEELSNKYGRIEDIPLAARNFKSLSREEWESLYRDLILRGK